MPLCHILSQRPSGRPDVGTGPVNKWRAMSLCALCSRAECLPVFDNETSAQSGLEGQTEKYSILENMRFKSSEISYSELLNSSHFCFEVLKKRSLGAFLLAFLV